MNYEGIIKYAWDRKTNSLERKNHILLENCKNFDIEVNGTIFACTSNYVYKYYLMHAHSPDEYYRDEEIFDLNNFL